MKVLLPLTVSLVVWICPLAADSPDTPSDEVSPAQLRNALGYLKSTDPDQRRSAYEACRERGESFRETYLQLLAAAGDHHAARINEVVDEYFRDRGGEFTEAFTSWREKSVAARESIQTNHSKEREKLDRMDALYLQAAGAWKDLYQSVPQDSTHNHLVSELAPHATALVEIASERDPGAADESRPTDPIEIALRHTTGGRLADYLEARTATTRRMQRLERAYIENNRLDWPDEPQKAFAAILNERRVTIGLDPLFLDRELSAACAGHSEEMARLGFFSHNSPTEENRTPGIRARNAGADNFAGECIFMGRAQAQAAERAWWYSCGHRLINYATGVKDLGIARHGVHWTLNTGR